MRLVAFDLDGTLVGEDLTIRPRVRAAAARMQQAGIAGCIVTGRMFRSAKPFVEMLGFTAPVVCYQGAAVVDPASGTFIRHTSLPNEQALELESYARNQGLHLQLYAGDRYYCEERNRYAQIYERISGVAPTVVASLRQTFASRDATKAVIIAEPEIVAVQLEKVHELFGRRAYVTRSIPWFLEVVNSAVDKGKAFEFVAERLGVPMEQTLAIGDSWNDEPLLRAAGFGVAMGSAPPELRAAADAIVSDVEHDGVAEAIERYVPVNVQ